MHQNGLPQWVSQLALQARVRARAWRRGDGDFHWHPSPQTREMEASVSVRECSSAVTGYTASSSNPARTFSTETQFKTSSLQNNLIRDNQGWCKQCKRHSVWWKKKTIFCETESLYRIIIIQKFRHVAWPLLSWSNINLKSTTSDCICCKFSPYTIHR